MNPMDIRKFIKGFLIGLMLLAVTVSYVVTYRTGYYHAIQQTKLEATESALKTVQVQQQLAKKQESVSNNVTTKYITKVEYIRGKEKTLIKEVPIYVSKASDDFCTIPLGFQLHWNKANTGELSDSAGSTDAAPEASTDYDAPTEIKLQDVAEQHAEEAIQCTATEEQLIHLQEWVKQQSNL
jgi:hypothetical protein